MGVIKGCFLLYILSIKKENSSAISPGLTWQPRRTGVNYQDLPNPTRAGVGEENDMSDKPKVDVLPQGAFDDAPEQANCGVPAAVPAASSPKRRWSNMAIIAILVIIAILAVFDGQVQRARLQSAETRLETVGAIVAPTWKPWRAFGRVGAVREALK